MQINLLQTGRNVGASQLEVQGKTARQVPTVVQNEPIKAEQPATAPAPIVAPERVTVSIDASRELVYRFLDPKTGEVVSQVPPEQVLEVVRGIQDLLRAEEHAKVPGVNVRG
jgi:hypothetical protein